MLQNFLDSQIYVYKPKLSNIFTVGSQPHNIFLFFFHLAAQQIFIYMNKERGDAFLLKFGQRVCTIRKAKNLSLRQLAQLCDIDHSDIAKIEKGQKNCQLLTLVELAAGLGVEVKDLVEF
jgi:DNA-binding XRE family transcriptional regulator